VTRELAARIARHDRTVLRYAKHTLDAVEHLPLQEGYVYEQSQTAELTGNERARASLAKTVARVGKA
jgi:enoyl-CoA hydratase